MGGGGATVASRAAVVRVSPGESSRTPCTIPQSSAAAQQWTRDR